MTARLIRVVVLAVALLLTALLVPDIAIDWADDAEGILLTLLALALVFGLINAFIRPIAKLVSVPLNVLTLGLFSVVLNGALLLLVAFVVDVAFGPLIVIGGFPPDLSLEAVGAAAVGSFIISVASAALTILIPDARGGQP
jgi:putative membrane protein